MYKYFVLFLIFSCSFYFDEYEIDLSDCSGGSLVISGDDGSYMEYHNNIPDKIRVSKYNNYFISYYKPFYNYDSLIPKGWIITPGNSSSRFLFRDGFITKGINELHSQGMEVSIENLSTFLDRSEYTWDLWVYSLEDFKRSMLGVIGVSTLYKRDSFPIESYRLLDNFIPENPLQVELYEGYHRFYSTDRSKLLTIEVNDRGEVISTIIR